MQIFPLRFKAELHASNWGKYRVSLNVVDFSRKFSHVEGVARPRAFLCNASRLVSRARKVSKYHVARLYSSVPINHLAHGPAIRLLEGGSYYPARLWWCTTSKPTLDLKLPLNDRPPHENSATAYKPAEIKWWSAEENSFLSPRSSVYARRFTFSDLKMSSLIYFIKFCRLTRQGNRKQTIEHGRRNVKYQRSTKARVWKRNSVYKSWIDEKVA